MAPDDQDEDLRRLKAQVERRRKALHLTLDEVFRRAGVSRGHYYEVIKGEKDATRGWLRRLASGLDWSLEDLLSRAAPRVPPVPKIREDRKVPLLNLRAAAGAFLDAAREEPTGYLRVPPPRLVTDDMFAATVVGRSMEKKIGNGDTCLFREMGDRDPENKVVLLQLRDARDPETGGRYTVKRYRVLERRGERITRVSLEPANRDFEPLVLEEDPDRHLTVVAQFLQVLSPGPG